MNYTYLSLSERAEIYKLRVTDKLSMSVIAVTMKRSKSTISRELNRNTSEKHKVYLPDTADETARQRRAEGKGRFKRISAVTIENVKQGLEQYHSPEQIAGRMKQEGKPKWSSSYTKSLCKTNR
jgi:IS30 family transposase